ncbi:N-acetylmuramidase domain-containing protein [Methylorubrum extorquens]|uniref:N-acetylmuramidase domain-containing protein n=1 Tax=Methylorubrum extorquens TaxID=408 RepID=UPI0028890D42|nr:N-acetylmuramidase domain-containing protein [Methylorubrum extorquens]
MPPCKSWCWRSATAVRPSTWPRWFASSSRTGSTTICAGTNGARFARGYNGASYAKHGYHTKLAKAFGKWSKIKDTPWRPGMGEPAAEPLAPMMVAPPSISHCSGATAAPSPSQPAPTSRLLRSGVQATGGAVRAGLSGLYDLFHTAFRKA